MPENPPIPTDEDQTGVPSENPHKLPNAPNLFVLLAVSLLSAIVQPIVQGQYLVPRVLVAVVTAVFLLVVAYRWKLSSQTNALRSSVERAANNFNVWFVVLIGMWVWTVVSNALQEVRLNNQIVANRNDELAIARVIDKAVMPRHLSQLQQVIIVDFLRRFTPHEYAFKLSNNDSEAMAYRGDIEGALDKAGWKLFATKPFDYANDVPEGLSVDLRQTEEHNQKQEAPNDPKTDKLFMMALGLAGVKLEGASEGSGGNITEDRFVISIGKRRLDSFVPQENTLQLR